MPEEPSDLWRIHCETEASKFDVVLLNYELMGCLESTRMNKAVVCVEQLAEHYVVAQIEGRKSQCEAWRDTVKLRDMDWTIFDHVDFFGQVFKVVRQHYIG